MHYDMELIKGKENVFLCNLSCYMTKLMNEESFEHVCESNYW